MYIFHNYFSFNSNWTWSTFHPSSSRWRMFPPGTVFKMKLLGDPNSGGWPCGLEFAEFAKKIAPFVRNFEWSMLETPSILNQGRAPPQWQVLVLVCFEKPQSSHDCRSTFQHNAQDRKEHPICNRVSTQVWIDVFRCPFKMLNLSLCANLGNGCSIDESSSPARIASPSNHLAVRFVSRLSDPDIHQVPLPLDPSAHEYARSWNLGIKIEWNTRLNIETIMINPMFADYISYTLTCWSCVHRLNSRDLDVVGQLILRSLVIFTSRVPWCAWSNSLAPLYDSCAASCDKSLPCDGRRWLGRRSLGWKPPERSRKIPLKFNVLIRIRTKHLPKITVSWRILSEHQAVIWCSKR